MPKLNHGDIETPDLAKLASYIKELSGAGAELFPDIDLENHLRREAGLPERLEDDELDHPDEDDEEEIVVNEPEPEEDAEKRN